MHWVPNRHGTESGHKNQCSATFCSVFHIQKTKSTCKMAMSSPEPALLSKETPKKDSDANNKCEESLLGTSESLFPVDVLVLAQWSNPDGCHNIFICVGTLCACFEKQKCTCMHVHACMCCVYAELHFHSKVQILSYLPVLMLGGFKCIKCMWMF